jgi:hypothetical protein
MIGFLFGMTLTCVAGYVYIVDDYQAGGRFILSAVEDLQKTVKRVAGQIKKIDNLEAEIKLLKDSCARKSEIELVRNDILRKVVSALCN